MKEEIYSIEKEDSTVLSENDFIRLEKLHLKRKSGNKSDYNAQEILDMLPCSISSDDGNCYILDIWKDVSQEDESVYWTTAYVPDYTSVDADMELIAFSSTNLLECSYNFLIWSLRNNMVDYSYLDYGNE